MRGWYDKKVTAVMALLMVLCLTGLGLLRLKLGPAGDEGDITLSVIIENHGVESGEMERTVTLPLEEGLSSLPGIARLRTISEYGKTRADMTLKKGFSFRKLYLELRDAVEGVFRTLPSSVQKPRIITGSADERPAFIVSFKPAHGRQDTEALNLIRSNIEKEVKPAFEKIEGTGEIEIGGGSIKELHIAVDAAKSAALDLSLSEIAGRIRAAQVEAPLGLLKNQAEELPVFVKGTALEARDFAGLPITLSGGSSVALGEIARVDWAYREGDMVSRVDGEKRVSLYVRSNGTANILMLCAQLRKTVLGLSENYGPDEIGQAEVLFDQSALLADSLSQLMKALGASIVLVCSVFIVFHMGSIKTMLLAVFLPVSLAATASLLTVFGMSIDHFVLTGFALGTGMIVDAGIVILESDREVKEIRQPLFSSTLTTVIVFIPLMAAGGMIPGLRQITTALSVMLLVSLVLGLMFLPVFSKEKRQKPKRPDRRLSGRHAADGLVRSALAHPRVTVAAAGLIVGSAVFCVVSMGRDFGGLLNGDTIFAHAEFESGSTLASVDARLLRMAEILNGFAGVEEVETLARPGSGGISMRINESSLPIREAELLLKKSGSEIPGCFVYIPQVARKGERSAELAFFGDDYEKLKNIAREASELLGRDDSVREVVLHFKEEPPSYIYRPDMEKTVEAGVFPSEVGDTLRAALQGPVIFKWKYSTENGKEERDVRIMDKGKQTYGRKELSDIPIAVGNGTVYSFGRLGSFTRSTEPSRIYRQNKQRSVYLTVHAAAASTDHLVGILDVNLSSLSLPEGYAWEADKSIYELRERINRLARLLVLAVVLVYMVLASQFESAVFPLSVMVLIPVSLSFPLLVLRLIGGTLTVPVLVGLIMLAGLVVNNGILITDQARPGGNFCRNGEEDMSLSGCPSALRRKVRQAVGKRLRPMVLTSVTTILGAIPLFFVRGEAGEFMRTLAVIIITGIAGSLLTTLTVLPVLICLMAHRKTAAGGC